MAYFIVPSRLRLQPRGSTAPSAFAKDTCQILLNGGDGRATELISGNQLVASGAGAVLAQGAGGIGYAINAALEKWQIASWDYSVSATDFTIEVLLTMTQADALSNVFVSTSVSMPHSGTTGIERGLLTYTGTPGNVYFWGGSADLNSTVVWKTDGTLQHVFVTATGGTMTFYRNGGRIFQGTTPTLSTTAPRYLVIGSRHSSGTGTAKFNLFKASIRNRALSVSEVAEISQYPWLDFVSSPKRIFFDYAVTAPGGISVPVVAHHLRQQGIQ